ncbi:MAG: hypothetical protein PVH88_00625 [Ignavibacteria bacterium]|jgi:hypothetical protein
MKIEAVVATTFKDDEKGWSFSDSALESLVSSAIGKPVIFKMKNVGVIEFAKYEHGKAIIQAKIENGDSLTNEKLFLVPGGLTDYDKKDGVIQKCIAHQYFLLEEQSNKELKYIEIVER